MAKTHVETLEGERLRYNDDTWELTGDLDVRQNGETIRATARKPDRVRGNAATLRFSLQDPPASLNPGNLGEFDAELKVIENRQYIVIIRNHATNHYRLKNLSYD